MAATTGYQYNIALIGDAEAGVDHLIVRWVENRFIGHDWLDLIMKHSFLKRFTSPCQHEITLNFFISFVGQEAIGWDGNLPKTSELHSKFLHSKITVICFDLTNRESFKKLSGLKRLLERFRGDKHTMMLIGTKGDLLERNVTTVEAQEWADLNGLPYFEISAKTGYGCDLAMNWILTFLDSEIVFKETVIEERNWLSKMISDAMKRFSE